MYFNFYIHAPTVFQLPKLNNRETVEMELSVWSMEAELPPQTDFSNGQAYTFLKSFETAVIQ